MNDGTRTWIRVGLTMLALLAVSLSSGSAQTKDLSDLELRRQGTQKLGFLVGEWETETWFYWDGKRPETPEKGTYSASWTLHDTFVTDDIRTLHNGNEYLGRGFHSYNPTTQKYETWYFDSDGIVVLYPNGQWEDDNTLVFKGRDANPSGVVEKHTYFQISSPDSFDLVEKQDYGDGRGFVTVLEVKYQRVRDR